MAFYRDVMRIALGEPVSAAALQRLHATAHTFDTTPGPLGRQMRGSSQSVMYLAFTATRDSTFRNYIEKWNGTPMAELDALGALSRGDTTAAEQLARGFTSPDSLRIPTIRFGVGGMRSVARAEVLAAVGRDRLAAETLDATEPSRFIQSGLAEPGYAVWVRSLLARARLWRKLGETERAVASYEEFIGRWANADGIAAQQVSEARRELAQLKDAPRSR
jgi:hypothetical protein